MASEWPRVPAETILTVRRNLITGGREQWTVSGDFGNLMVLRFWLDADDSWQESPVRTNARDLAALRFTELRKLAKGTITEYRIKEGVLEPPILVSMVEADTAGGPETAEDWPGDVGREWAESDAVLCDWTGDFDWFPRWARVNDIRVSSVEITLPDATFTQPVLADESMEELVPASEIAREALHSESGGAPISWDGGHTLSLLAPGLGYQHPDGDSWETEEFADPFLRLPADPLELGALLADWGIGTESDVAAALAIEPLDPGGELSTRNAKHGMSDLGK